MLIKLDLGSLEVLDARDHKFTSGDLPDAVSGYLLDRTSLISLLRHGRRVLREVRVCGDLSGLHLKNLDLSYAIINCEHLPASFKSCNLQGAIIIGDGNKTKFSNCKLAFTDMRSCTGLEAHNFKNNVDQELVKTAKEVKIKENKLAIKLGALVRSLTVRSVPKMDLATQTFIALMDKVKNYFPEKPVKNKVSGSIGSPRSHGECKTNFANNPSAQNLVKSIISQHPKMLEMLASGQSKLHQRAIRKKRAAGNIRLTK